MKLTSGARYVYNQKVAETHVIDLIVFYLLIKIDAKKHASTLECACNYGRGIP